MIRIVVINFILLISIGKIFSQSNSKEVFKSYQDIFPIMGGSSYEYKIPYIENGEFWILDKRDSSLFLKGFFKNEIKDSIWSMFMLNDTIKTCDIFYFKGEEHYLSISYWWNGRIRCELEEYNGDRVFLICFDPSGKIYPNGVVPTQ